MTGAHGFCTAAVKVHNEDPVAELQITARRGDLYGGRRPTFTVMMTESALRQLVEQANAALARMATSKTGRRRKEEIRAEIARVFRDASRPG